MYLSKDKRLCVKELIIKLQGDRIRQYKLANSKEAQAIELAGNVQLDISKSWNRIETLLGIENAQLNDENSY